MRGKLFIVIFLIFFLTILLLFQWAIYVDKNKELNRQVVTEKITIKVSIDSLRIEQIISGLEFDKYFTFVLPVDAENWKCVTGIGSTCRLGKKPNSFLSEKGIFHVNYELPFNKGEPDSLYPDWKLALKETEVQTTNISITDMVNNSSGTWITGLPLIGAESLDFINFYHFSGNGDNRNLYYTQEKLEHYSEGNITVYAPIGYTPIPKFNFIRKVDNHPYLDVVLNADSAFYDQNLIILKSNSEIIEGEKQWMYKYFQNKFVDGLDWFSEILVAHLLNDKPTTVISAMVYNELVNELQENELNDFIDRVTTQASPLTGQNLDEILTTVKGLRTSFFKGIVSRSHIPTLYFYQENNIIFNDNPMTIQTVYLRGNTLLPVKEIGELLGYEVVRNGTTVMLTKMGHHFYFDSRRKIYKYNSQEFGLFDFPMNVLDDNLYIEEKVLMAIFNIIIKKDKDGWTVSSN